MSLYCRQKFRLELPLLVLLLQFKNVLISIHSLNSSDYQFKVLAHLAVVVAKYVEPSFPTPEGRGSNTVIRKIYIER